MPIENVPGWTGPAGMPIGLSLIGLPYHDTRLLKIAELVGACFEEAAQKA